MNKVIFFAGVLSGLLQTVALGESELPAIIPLPQSVVRQAGDFTLKPVTRISVNAAAKDTGAYLAGQLRKSTGYKLAAVESTNGLGQMNVISLVVDASATNNGAEGYELTVTPEAVTIRAAEPAGAFYGVQTLLQLLPTEVFSPKAVKHVAWTIPCVAIQDQPRFPWRGYMLDVSRHFFNKDEIKQTLDFMAMHKLNVFHWHLTDDHGWRLEIKKYPLLTQVGAWRKHTGFNLDPKESNAYGPDGRYGGFYTQDDVREIVAYAAARHIEVLPEIEMPGHSVAALEAYPQYSCTGGPFDTDLDAGVFHGIYCPGNEETFTFLENILTEVFDLFPSKYIHIGGDEVPKDNWEHCEKCQALIKREGLKNEHELQSYFIQRIEKFIDAHDRKLIGWSEIRDGGLAPSAAVMDWIGGGAEAASAGHDVVMTPQQLTYLCYYQSLDRPPKLMAQRPQLTLQKVYSFDPIPTNLAASAWSHVLGAQDCVWTVYFGAFAEVEEMTFPRLCAFSETVWSPKASLGFEGFTNRLATHEQRLAERGIYYWTQRASQIGEWEPAQVAMHPATLDWDIPADMVAGGQYRLCLNYLKGHNGLKIEWAALLENGKEVMRDTHLGLAGAGYNRPIKARDWNYFLKLAKVKPGAKYSVRVSATGDGGTDSKGVVFLEPPGGLKKN